MGMIEGASSSKARASGPSDRRSDSQRHELQNRLRLQGQWSELALAYHASDTAARRSRTSTGDCEFSAVPRKHSCVVTQDAGELKQPGEAAFGDGVHPSGPWCFNQAWSDAMVVVLQVSYAVPQDTPKQDVWSSSPEGLGLPPEAPWSNCSKLSREQRDTSQIWQRSSPSHLLVPNPIL
ncbi:hypothetical protein DPEC_G00026950 [Dallia pectoralis]|uniref:Uncharacterized protein n=1 Tax=Dallia pectoralis TaxID=75939 RepID=A0ACC2HI63_DALPE|nr:hypothetical protein DPEC_G00026950 [Dallia pectoralis]